MSDTDTIQTMIANINGIVAAKRADLVNAIRAFETAHNEQASALEGQRTALQSQMAQIDNQIAVLVDAAATKIQPLIDEFTRFEATLAAFKDQASLIAPAEVPTVALVGAPPAAPAEADTPASDADGSHPADAQTEVPTDPAPTA